MKRFYIVLPKLLLISVVVLLLNWRARVSSSTDQVGAHDNAVNNHALRKVERGRNIFRFDTFGDEDFWGGTLQIHKAIEGKKLGGIGPGVDPETALAVGLKVDQDALPASLIRALRQGQVNLKDPAVTLALLKLNAVVGLTGFFGSSGELKSVGIQCAICHSTVDNSLARGLAIVSTAGRIAT